MRDQYNSQARIRDKDEFSAITEMPDKEDFSGLINQPFDDNEQNLAEMDDDEISGLEEPFEDYEDKIDLSMNDEVNKENMMDGMRVFDYSDLEQFHQFNLNVKTSKRLRLNDDALQAAISSSDDEDNETVQTEEK